MRAEAYARTGKLTEAIADINLLRRYRFKTGTPPLAVGTQDEVIAAVLQERRRELPASGIKRFLDLKRFVLDAGKPWQKTKVVHTLGQKPSKGPSTPICSFSISPTPFCSIIRSGMYRSITERFNRKSKPHIHHETNPHPRRNAAAALDAGAGYPLSDQRADSRPEDASRAYLYYRKDGANFTDSSELTNGAFAFKGAVSSPQRGTLVVRAIPVPGKAIAMKYDMVNLYRRRAI